MKKSAMFKIEKSEPIPQVKMRSSWPFGDMEVGDSFLIPEGSPEQRTVASAASYYGTRNGKKFSQRLTEEGTRVWRVS